METFMALAGQLANAGIEGSVAGTTLKNMFLTLSAPTKEATAGLAKLGVKTRDTKGNLLDTVTILQQLQSATAKMGKADKAGALEGIFGKIPIAGISALLDNGIDKVGDLQTKLRGATGATATMAGIMRESVRGDIDGFTSAIEGVSIAIFQVARAPLRNIIQGITDWVTANKDLVASRAKEYITWTIANLPLLVEWLGKIVKGVVVFYAVAAAVRVATVALTAYQLVSRAAAVVTGFLTAMTLRSRIAYIVMTAALWADTAATYASSAAKAIWNGLTNLGMLTVGLLVTATQASTYATAGNTAVTWLSTAARTVWSTITGTATAILAAYNAGTLLATIRQGAMNAITWLGVAATAALNATLLANPYVLVGIAVVAFIGYLLKLLGVWDAVSGAVKKFGSWAMSYLGPVIGAVKKLLGLVTSTVSALDDLPTGIPGMGPPVGEVPGMPGGFNMEADAATTQPFTVAPGAGMAAPLPMVMPEAHSTVDLNITAPPGYQVEGKSSQKNTTVRVSDSGGSITPIPAYAR
jgi:hypothetical protein